MSANRHAIGVLAAVAVLIALPFLNRPYFVDDYYFVQMAKGILAHPLRPYDFRTNDAGKDNPGWELGQRPRMVNPPVFHYYLAGVMKVFGDSEIVLRGSLIPFSIAALIAMFFLGKRFTPEPLGAALLMALTPAYWLTSYALLIDSMLIAFVLCGLWAFVASHERRSVPLAALAGGLLGLAMLVKYFGVIGIVLAAVWHLMDVRRRAWRGGFLTLVIFLALQAAWAAWNFATYGQSHFLSTLPRGMTSTGLFMVDKFFMTASFFGGATVFALAGYALLLRRSRTAFLSLMLLLASAMLLFQSRIGGFTLSQSIQLSVWMGASFAFWLTVLFWRRDLTDESGRFLIAWLGVGLLELLVVMPWTAGRYFLCSLPAACWLMTRMIPRERWHTWGTALTALTGAIGLMVASADYLQASAIQQLAQVLSEKPSPNAKFYLGDTFSGYEPYLKPLGWEAAFPDQAFKKGDLLLIPRYRQSSWWRLPPTLRLEPVEAYQFQSPLAIRVMDIPGSAGWYASVWGSLPWVITRDPLERFELYRVM